MSKIKEWLKPRNNKIIAGVASTVIVIALVTTVIVLNSKPQGPTVIFKDNIILEYGQTIKDPTKKPIEGTYLNEFEAKEFVITEKSSFDQLSFQLIPKEGEKTSSTLNKIDTMKLGKQKGKLYAKLDKVVGEFEFEYEVKDTNKPILEDVKDIETEYGITPVYKELFKAKDLVDGELEITILGEVDYHATGTYKLVAVATDKNSNKTEQPFKVTVKAEAVEVEHSGETDGSENNESNTNGSTSNNVGNNSNTSNPGGNNNSNNGAGDNSNNGIIPPVIEDPKVPEIPEQEIPEGLYFYKKYPDFAACNAAADDEAWNHVNEWNNNICFDDGSMYYRPR